MRALLAALVLLQAPPAPDARVAETVANVQAVPIAGGTAADLALPEEHLQRVADRILRASFESRFRAVVAGDRAAKAASSEPGSRTIGQRVLDALALLALVAVAVLGFLAWRAWSRRRA